MPTTVFDETYQQLLASYRPKASIVLDGRIQTRESKEVHPVEELLNLLPQDKGSIGAIAARRDQINNIEVINRSKTSNEDGSPLPKTSYDLESLPQGSGVDGVSDLLSRFTCLTAEEIFAVQC